MTWVIWRQYRTQLAVLTTALLAVLLLLTAGRHQITGPGVERPFAHISDILVGISIGFPVLLGVFLGATLIARETENGTNVLAWTQTVNRRHWLVTKLSSVLLATLAWSVALSVVITWWAKKGANGSPFEGLRFDTEHVAPIGYALFAVALGFAAGAVLRRMLPAVGTTVGGFLVMRIAVEVFARPHFARPVTVNGPMNVRPGNIGFVSQILYGPDGKEVIGPIRVPDDCVRVFTRKDSDHCLADHGYHFVTKYHPWSHYWHMQWLEFAIFAGVAAVLVAIGSYAVLRRDA